MFDSILEKARGRLPFAVKGKKPTSKKSRERLLAEMVLQSKQVKSKKIPRGVAWMAKRKESEMTTPLADALLAKISPRMRAVRAWRKRMGDTMGQLPPGKKRDDMMAFLDRNVAEHKRDFRNEQRRARYKARRAMKKAARVTDLAGELGTLRSWRNRPGNQKARRASKIFSAASRSGKRIGNPRQWTRSIGGSPLIPNELQDHIQDRRLKAFSNMLDSQEQAKLGRWERISRGGTRFNRPKGRLINPFRETVMGRRSSSIL